MDVEFGTDVPTTWYQSIPDWRDLVTSPHHELLKGRVMRDVEACSIGCSLNRVEL
jgi:hypothetical protein